MSAWQHDIVRLWRAATRDVRAHAELRLLGRALQYSDAVQRTVRLVLQPGRPLSVLHCSSRELPERAQRSMASIAASALSSRVTVARPTSTRPRCVAHAYPLLPSLTASGVATPVSLPIYPHGARRAGTLTRSPPPDVARDTSYVTTNPLSSTHPILSHVGSSAAHIRYPGGVHTGRHHWCIGGSQYAVKWLIP